LPEEKAKVLAGRAHMRRKKVKLSQRKENMAARKSKLPSEKVLTPEKNAKTRKLKAEVPTLKVSLEKMPVEKVDVFAMKAKPMGDDIRKCSEKTKNVSKVSATINLWFKMCFKVFFVCLKVN